MVVTLRIKFQQCWFFKCLRNQGILDTLFTTSRTVLYFYSYFYAEWKIVVKIFTKKLPQKCLFTLRMTRVFIKCLNEYGRTFTELFMITIQGWNELKNSYYLQVIWYWIQRVTLPTFLPQAHWLIAIGTWAAETRVCWWCQIFHKIIICIKTFLCQKDNYSSCEFWNFPIRYWQPLEKLSSLCPASGVWTGILLIRNVTP